MTVVVDSAGCSAQLKEVGDLSARRRHAAFSERVLDITEVLAERVDALVEACAGDPMTGDRPLVAIQDPCHLRHVQRAHLSVRTVLEPFYDLVELDDDGLCCGAGGAFSIEHPTTAAEIRERKLAAIARSGAVLVASANPGCAMHLSAAGVDVRHPVELLDEALNRSRGR